MERFKSLVSYRGRYKTNVPQPQRCLNILRKLFSERCFLLFPIPLGLGSTCLFERLPLASSLVFRQFVRFPGPIELFLGHSAFFFLIIEPGTVTRKLQRRSLPCEGRDIILNLFFSGISHGPPARPRCIYFYHGRGVIWRHVYTASVKYGYVDYFFSLSLPCAPVILTEPPSCVDPRFYCAFPFASCSVNAKDRI